MKNNEQLMVADFRGILELDTYAEGVKGEAEYSDSNYIDMEDRKFEDIWSLLYAVCESLGYAFVKKAWEWDPANEAFFTDFLVDEGRYEVNPNSFIYEQWQDGKADLYNFRVMVRPVVVSTRKFTENDIDK